MPNVTYSSLDRSLFVGRQAELEQLRAAFQAAVAGDGVLVAMPGEPGIGKTTLCQQFMREVADLGGRALIGHSYEPGAPSLPYFPFVEALRRYVLDRDTTALEAELGTGAPDVARILSEIGDRLGVEVRPAGDPEDDRWRLLEAVTSFLRSAAAAQPMLLVLEDLHDADRGSLDMLVHLARQLSGSRLVVVGTYRDVEVDRTHPLSSSLAELRRWGHYTRLPLRGLTVDEVHRLYCLVRGQEVPRSRTDAVYQRTGGNPLFVQEILRYLVESGVVVRLGERYIRTDDGSPEGGIPEGLRDVVGKRLSHLGAECNRLLSVAAVIGRELDLAVLRDIASMDEEALTAALEEAVRAGVFEEQSRQGAIRYRFAHAFFRQALYEELIAPRRLRLHQQVARALEARYATRLDEHAAELAEHFAQSTDSADLAKAIAYGQRAALRAMSVYAYGEAARLLEQALQVLEVLDPDADATRCDLLLQLGEALIPAGEPRRATEEIAPQAVTIAERLADHRRASRASQLALEGMVRYGGAPLERSPMFREWAERADRYAAPGTTERVYADHALGNHKALVGQEHEAALLLERALVLARELGEPEALFRSAWKLVMWAQGPRRGAQRLQTAAEFAARARDGVNHRTLGTFLWYALLAYLEAGQRHRVEELGAEVAALGERTHDPALLWRPLVLQIIVRTLDGELERAREAARDLIVRADEMGMGVLGRTQAYHWEVRARLYSGRLEASEADAFLTERDTLIVLGPLRVAAGDRSGARAALQRFLAGRDIGSDEDEPSLSYLLPCLETATLLGDTELATVLTRQLAPAVGCAATLGAFTSVARVLGTASVLCGDRPAARSYFEQALELATRLRFRPELALVHLDFAELLLDEPGAADEATQHADIAVSELTAMRMLPFVERAHNVRQRIPAPRNQRVVESAASSRNSPADTPVDVLSAREREVAALLATGIGNRAIAEALVISESTAEVHVKHILSKLGFKSRAQIAVWATQHGLMPDGPP